MQALQIIDTKIQVYKTKADVIHERAMVVAADLKSKYLEFFEILIEVESELIYLQFEIPSLYQYCVELLELSPQITKDFIVVVRKSFEVPALAEAVREKKVTISRARKICSVLTEKNSKEWIELAADSSTRIIEKCVAQANPKHAVHEALTYASEERLELRLGVSEEWAELLTQTKDLLSQQLKRNIDSEEAIFILMKEHCRKNDPVEKALRVETKKLAKLKAAVEAKVDARLSNKTAKSRSRDLPASVDHEVTLRDGNRCTYVNSKGKRCDSRRWLHKHHIKHFAEGGKHTVENLETLCSGHHKIKHLREREIGVT